MRTTTLRLLQTSLALGAIALLTGANDPGCANVSADSVSSAASEAALGQAGGAATSSDAIACLAGTHVETLCAPPDGKGDGKGPPGEGGAPPKGEPGKGPKAHDCQAACVPDPVCGDTQKAAWICGGPPKHPKGDKAGPPPKGGVGGAADGQGPPPPPPGAGMGGAPPDGDHGDEGLKGGAGGGDCEGHGPKGAPKGPPPGCHVVCVDPAPCADGYAEVVACADPPRPPKGDKAGPPPKGGVGGAPAEGDKPPLPAGCALACMPAAPCADGLVEVDVCGPPPPHGEHGPGAPPDGAGGAPPAPPQAGEGGAPPDGGPPGAPPCVKVCAPKPPAVDATPAN